MHIVLFFRYTLDRDPFELIFTTFKNVKKFFGVSYKFNIS